MRIEVSHLAEPFALSYPHRSARVDAQVRGQLDAEVPEHCLHAQALARGRDERVEFGLPGDKAMLAWVREYARSK